MHTDELIKVLLDEIKDIKEILTELCKQSAVHNHVLSEHEKRSTSLERTVQIKEEELERRLKPLEDDYKFKHRALLVLTGGGGLLAVISVILQLLRK